MTLIKIDDRTWVNPAEVVSLIGNPDSTRIHFTSGTYRDVHMAPDQVVAKISEASL